MRRLALFAAVAATALSTPALARTTRGTTWTQPTVGNQVASTAQPTRASTAPTNTSRPSQINTARNSKGMAAPSQSSSQGTGSTVAIISGGCDSLTDGDAAGCAFTGNINTNTNGNASYLLAQDAYNAAFNPDIALNPLLSADSSQFLVGGKNFIDNANGTYTFNLDDNLLLNYFAVKGANQFTLYQYIGGLDNSYTFASNNLSHVVFFGSQGTPGGVPEPGTWGMMLVGFGAIGFAMRRRSRAQPALRLA